MEKRLNNLIKQFLKEGKKGELTQFRMLKSEINKFAKDKRIEVDNYVIENSTSKFIKQIDEQLDYLAKTDEVERTELLKRVREIAMAEFMPVQLTDEEVICVVKDILTKNELSGMKNMGNAMKLCGPVLKGKADGKFISTTVRNILGGK